MNHTLKFWYFYIFVIFFQLPALSENNAPFEIQADGSINAGNLSMKVIYFNPKWQRRVLNARSLVTSKFDNGDERKTINGIFKLFNGNKFNVQETLTNISANKWKYQAEFFSSTPVPTNVLALSISLKCQIYAGQHIFVNNRPILLPEKVTMKSGGHIWSGKARTLTIHTASQQININGNFTLRVQDNRKYTGDDYSIRINFPQSHGNITKTKLDIDLSTKTTKTESIDIRQNVNMAFADEIKNDRKGGWTDQGPTNDLRKIKSGTQNLKGVRFNLIDPVKNNGKSCIMFAGPDRDYFLKSALIDVPEVKGKYLYVAHATAWTPKNGEKIGKIKFLAKDGSTSQIDLISQQDVGDWWSPVDMPNAKVAWRTSTESCNVGIYVSRFLIPGKTLSKLEFIPSRKAVWGVLALSIGDYIPFIPPRRNKKAHANQEWHKFEHNVSPKENSIMDFSFMNDAPAGKYGQLIAQNGKFVFAKRKNVPVRFWGTNLCFQSNFMDNKDAERFADRLIAQGYNCIRLHHFDNMLTKTCNKDTFEFNEKRMKQLDYLVYYLKKRGIYISIDLYISREIEKGSIPSLNFDYKHDMKALYPVNQEVRNNWKNFSTKLLNHVNPYTGLAWKDDPVLISICPINENYLYVNWKRDPEVKNIYIAEFKKWCMTNKIKFSAASEKNPDFCRFINQLQMNMNKDMIRFLKNELKIKTLLTDVNHGDDRSQIPLRNTLDYIDIHAYWDHPSFPGKRWRFPFGFNNSNIINSLAFVPRHIMASRIFNKAFCVTEFNYCFPNNSRGIGSMMMGAYAALQDWDGIFTFDSRSTSKIRVSVFDIMADPVSYFGNRIICLLYRRGDVQRAKNSFVYLFSDKDSSLRKSYPAAFSKLGLVSKIGSIDTRTPGYTLPVNCMAGFGIDKPNGLALPFFTANNNLSNTLNTNNPVKEGVFDLKNLTFVSDTGEIKLNGPKGLFRVITPRSEGFALNKKGKAKGNCVTVDMLSPKSNLIFVSSMDGNNIAKSKKLLLIHLTDAINTNLEYQDDQSSIVTNWGELPLLVRRGSAKLAISFDKALKTEVWAITPSGERLKQLKINYNKNKLEFHIATDLSKKGVAAYEIIRK